MSTARRGLLLAAWIAVVAVLGWVVERTLVVGTDLRLFLPSPRTPQERLVLEEIGEGPASRMLLLAISGGTPRAAADTSRALAAALRGSGEFRLVANGEFDARKLALALDIDEAKLGEYLDALCQFKFAKETDNGYESTPTGVQAFEAVGQRMVARELFQLNARLQQLERLQRHLNIS